MKTVSMAVGNRRLLKLAAFLRKLPRGRFDYGRWVGDDWQGAQDLSCGTTGCALGWAATMPTFRRLGLYLDSNGAPSLRADDSASAFDVAAALFGIAWWEATGLFAPDLGEENATPTYVARKIERFVRGRAE